MTISTKFFSARRGEQSIQWESAVTWTALGLITAFQLWVARGALQPAAYLNDSSMHEQMVRFAANALRHGHFPMSQWYSGLDLGSPQFLHYQGLAATLAGAVGLVIAPNVVFRWSLYLMWSAWPLVIYGASRVFTLPRRVALAAAAVSVTLISVPLVGYEIGAYMWAGYGIWAQLSASCVLPFAWAWSWRALEDRRYLARAVACIALTTSLHFETGYSAFLAVGVMTLIVRSDIRSRLQNAAVLLLLALLATSWITVPLLLNAKWAAINTALVNTGLVRGYGARQNISWLLHGHLFDDQRFPIVTGLLAVGFLFALWRWRGYRPTRAFAALFVVVFLLSFGPTTWGSLLALLPGHADIYFRRFLLSVHLAGILLSGVGVAALGDLVERRLVPSVRRQLEARQPRTAAIRGWGAMAVVCVVVVVAYPSIDRYGTFNNNLAVTQVLEQRTPAQQLAPILDYVRSHPIGRVYAGSILNWGANFTVGSVQMNIYLADNDIDQVGFVLRTASLMEQPEYDFSAIPASGPRGAYDHNLGNYAIMGIHYILMPVTMTPPVPAKVVMTSGPYRLWGLPGIGYTDLITSVGSIDENKATVHAQDATVFGSHLLEHHQDYLVNWTTAAAVRTVPGLRTSPGTVTAGSTDLANGHASMMVTMTHSGVAVLAASYDPGWTVTVDGVQRPTVMVAPAIVGVNVSPGTHRIVFQYRGFAWYWLVDLASIAGLGMAYWFARRSDNRMFAK